MRFYRWLQKYPSETIADTVGVRPDTVRRWRTRGIIPDRYSDAVNSVRSKRIASPARMRKVLRDIDVHTLAQLSGVTVREARKWKVAKTIPLDKRMFLVDSFAESSEFRMKKAEIKSKETKNYIFSEISFRPNTLLTDSILIEIIRSISKAKIPKKSRLQVRFIGYALLQPDDKLLRYQLVEYKFTTKGVKATPKWYTGLFSNKELLLEGVKEELLSQLDKEMILKDVTILVRERK